MPTMTNEDRFIEKNLCGITGQFKMVPSILWQIVEFIKWFSKFFGESQSDFRKEPPSLF